MASYIPVPRDVSIDEAKTLPTFFRVLRVNRPDYSCEACREHSREAWVDGSACDEHTISEVAFAGDGSKAASAAELALKVLRAGGSPEPRFGENELGFAQFNYKRKGAKAAWSADVFALTFDHDEHAAIAA